MEETKEVKEFSGVMDSVIGGSTEPMVGTVEVVEVVEGCMPSYETIGSAGCDLRIAEDIVIKPGDTKRVSLGIKLNQTNCPGLYAQTSLRSSVASKIGTLMLTNSVGIIDNDYTGVVMAEFYNYGKAPVRVEALTRMVQMVFGKYEQAEFIKVDEVSVETDRGSGGFGSTDEVAS